jgi:hypothetical protein
MNRLKGLSAAWLFSLSVANAFVVDQDPSGNPRHWNITTPDPQVHTNVFNRKTKAIRYFLGLDDSRTNEQAELNAIRAAFAQWQAIPGTTLKFEEGGLIGEDIDVANDDRNVIFWAKSTFVNGGIDNISGSLAVTTWTTFTGDNTMIKADTVLNGVQFSWFTDFSTTNTAAYFVEASALHEIGHFIGLDHSPVGGATMFVRSRSGVSAQAGLSSDEIAAARFLYSKPSTLDTLGALLGRVTMNGRGILGAVVILENGAGNVISGSLTHANGHYELNAVPPGDYFVRVSPLDPIALSKIDYLLRGWDIDGAEFPASQTDFLPADHRPVTLRAGRKASMDFQVVSGVTPFRITRIHAPSSYLLPDPYAAPATIHPGQSNLFVGVYSPNLPTGAATLTITGDGLTLGPTSFLPNAYTDRDPDRNTLTPVNLMSVSISVASNATPGLRSFVVQQGENIAYANGFLEVLPLVPDYNFDGLDDTFQRRYFPLFTAPEAAPGADPDGDGFTNDREHLAGSDPTNPLSLYSLFKIIGVKRVSEGTTITFQTDPGKRYQVYDSRQVESDPWQPIGSPVTARAEISDFFDASATNTMRFYRVQALP